MAIELTMMDVREIVIEDTHWYPPDLGRAKGFRSTTLVVRVFDGPALRVKMFSDSEDCLPVIDRAGCGRICKECGDMLTRHTPPAVTVCSACETQGAAIQGAG